MSSKRIDNIEVLSEQIESLQITNKSSDETIEQSDTVMSEVPVPIITNTNEQAVMPKNMVSNSEWFDRNRTKFKDWWREM